MEEEKVKILDTNVLLDYPQIVTKENEYWIIPLCVLREIDGLKMSSNIETATKARKAAVYISKNKDNIEFNLFEGTGTVDNQLMEITKAERGVLITNDIALKVIARAQGIETHGYTWDETYTGSYKINVDDLTIEQYTELLNKLLEDGFYENEEYSFSENEFLFVPPPENNLEYGEPSIFRLVNKKFKPVRAKGHMFENQWTGKIFPKNLEQLCLVDLLLDSNVKIIYAGGNYGTGKTFLTHNYAISELEQQNIKKIVYIPNNSYTRNTLELGALPGKA